jgi:hypothetical protein
VILDGQARWKLNTPGGRIHNGLIVGPPECGKINTLRIIVIEAAASGLFVPMLADPRDSNRHTTGLGCALREEYFSNDLPGTAELLRALNRIITYDRKRRIQHSNHGNARCCCFSKTRTLFFPTPSSLGLANGS